MEIEGDTTDAEPAIPALSAGYSKSRKKVKKSKNLRHKRKMLVTRGGGRTRKLKYRDMVINAIKAAGEMKGTDFNKICRYVEKKYKMKNDFIVRHTLKWLCDKKLLSKRSGRYKLLSPTCIPSAGRSRRRRRGKSRRRRRRRKGRRGGRRRRRRRRRGGKKKKGRGKKRRGGRRRRRRGRRGKGKKKA